MINSISSNGDNNTPIQPSPQQESTGPSIPTITTTTSSQPQLVSSSTLKIVLDGCDVWSNPVIQQGLVREFGLDCWDLPLAYPFKRFVAMLGWLRGKLYSTESEAGGDEQIGRRCAEGFFRMGLGVSIGSNASLLGVKLMLPIFFQQVREVLDFSEIAATSQGANCMSFMIGNVEWPAEIVVGMLKTMLEKATAKGTSVSYHSLSEKDTEFEVTWQA
jgi:uncharacterized protein (TIGR02265 family)